MGVSVSFSGGHDGSPVGIFSQVNAAGPSAVDCGAKGNTGICAGRHVNAGDANAVVGTRTDACTGVRSAPSDSEAEVSPG